MNPRILGLICIVGSVIWAVDGIRWLAVGLTDFDTIGRIAGVIWAVGGICALIGMLQLNAFGPNPIARALSGIAIIGFAAIILVTLMQIAGLDSAELMMLSGIGWILQLVGTLVVAVLTIVAKVWQGWRRYVPLLCIASVFVGAALGVLVGNTALGTPIAALTWALLGYAVFSAADTAAQRPVQAVHSV